MKTEQAKRDDSGPAFPVTISGQPQTDCATTLRDYLAAKAMAATIVTLTDSPTRAALIQIADARKCRIEDVVAAASYDYADAFLKARSL